jgi:ribosomal protein S7, bacterial/organelle
MPRRGGVKPRIPSPDPIHKNRVLTKFVNRAMHDGKKLAAQREIYEALDIIAEKTGEKPMKFFMDAMEAVKPSMEVRPRRVGGAAYQIPIPVKGPRKESLAIRWIIMNARARSGSEYRSFAQKLAAELMDAAKGLGGSVKKKMDMERMAEANRAFAHFRW